MGSEVRLPPGDADPLVRAAVLADPRQRRLLSILLEQSGPTTERDLAVQLVAREGGGSPSDVNEGDLGRIREDLHHRWLPKLEATGWTERRPEGIVAVEQRFSRDTRLSLPDFEDPDFPSWEALATVLARPRRQHVVSILVDHARPLALEELGAELLPSGRTSWTRGRRSEERTLLSVLHHVDLPKLEEAGLIEYDADERTVTRDASLEALVDRTGVGDAEDGTAGTGS